MQEAVLEALEKLEAAIMEMEMQAGPEVAGEALDEARGRLLELTRVCQAEALRELDPPCQWVASLLDMLETGAARPGQEAVDLLLGPIDIMRRLLFLGQGEAKEEAGGGEGGQAAPRPEPETAADQPPPAAPAPPPARTIPSAIKVDTDKLDGLLDILGELVITYALSSRHPALHEGDNRALSENMQTLGGLLEELEGQIAAIRRLPLNNLFMRMQRLVRDVAAKVGKKAELVAEGGDIELDKGLLEELNDPLVHLLRNAVDHGLENPDQRRAVGKPEAARLEVRAQRRDQHLEIVVRDDGRGLDRDRILAKAREKGLADEGRPYSDQEVFRFITMSGFSTAAQVTDISGRGVGLDVVARAVAQMGAELEIDSTPGAGAAFSIRVPLNRVVSDGITEAIVFTAGQELYAIPSRQVTEVAAHDQARVLELADRTVVENRGGFFNLVDLAQVLNCPGRRQAPPEVLIMAQAGGGEVALLGDELVGQQQVVLRSLEKRAFPASAMIAGCALLGDRMGLMLDPDGLAAHLEDGA